MPNIAQPDTGVFGIKGSAEELGFVGASFAYNASGDVIFYVASRPMRVTGIIGRVRVVGSDGGAVTAQIRKVPDATAPTGGVVLHSGTYNQKGTADTNQVLTLSATSADLDMIAGDALVFDSTGTTTAAIGLVTVNMAPR